MSLSINSMINILHDLGYDYIKVKGGRAKLEDAPTGNIFYAYKSITGKIAKMNLEQRKKYNQVKPV